MRVQMWRGLVLAAAVVVVAGCPGSGVEEDPEGSSGTPGGNGALCSVDGDCISGLCAGGVCSGSAGSSSSSSSSSGMASSSGGMDAGAGDAAVPDAGPRAHIELTPDGSGGPLEFGATRIGSAVTQNVLITNTGPVAAQLYSLAFSGNASGEFTMTVVGGQPASIGPGEQVAVRITHLAVDASADNAALVVVTNADNPQVQLPLSAEFKGNPLLVVSVAPDSGNDVTTLQVPATPLEEPVTAHLYVKNEGAADSALTVTSVSLDPPASALFAVSAGALPRSVSRYPGPCTDLSVCSPGAAACTGGLCVADMAAGGHPLDLVDIAVTFNAAQLGEANVNVVIMALVGGVQVTRSIAVAALATENRLEVTPNPIAFGNVFVGRTRTIPVTLKNPDNATNVINLTDLGIRFTPAPFTLSQGAVPAALTPGSSVVVNVTYAPTAVSMSNNALAVYRQGGQPIFVPITAAAVEAPVIQVSPALDFGGVVPGNPRTLPLAVNNTGLGDLNVSNIEITPPTAPFSVLPTMIDTVAPMGMQNVQVSFTPTMEGQSYAATMLIHSNDPATPLVQVQLSGLGVTPGLELSRTGIDFGAVLIGSTPSPTQTVVVRNSGGGSLELSGVLRVANAGNVTIPQYTVTSSRNFPVSVASGDAVTLTLTFAPTTNTVYAGNLVFETNDPMRPTVTLPVTGTGHNCAAVPNATVQVINGTQCAYQCVAGAVSCDADTCIPCPGRHAATPTCGAGDTCTYTCPGGTGENDPGNTCSNALNVGNIQGDKIVFLFNLGGGNPYSNNTFRIPSSGDQDWFRFRMKDRADSQDGQDLAGLQAVVRLSNVAQGEQLNLEVRDGSCNGGSQSVVVVNGQVGEVASSIYCDRGTFVENDPSTSDDDQIIPIDDSRDFFVRVSPVGDSWQCTTYNINIEVFEETFVFECLF